VPVQEVIRFTASEGLVRALGITGTPVTDYTLNELGSDSPADSSRVSRADPSTAHIQRTSSNGDGSATLTLSDGSTVHVSRRRRRTSAVPFSIFFDRSSTTPALAAFLCQSGGRGGSYVAQQVVVGGGFDSDGLGAGAGFRVLGPVRRLSADGAWHRRTRVALATTEKWSAWIAALLAGAVLLTAARMASIVSLNTLHLGLMVPAIYILFVSRWEGIARQTKA
jgi:hypothetical protein